MEDHISAVCRSGFFSAATTQVDQTVVDAGCSKDAGPCIYHYCNQLFVGVTGRLLDKLQLLQNAAARLVTGARKFDRITPVMWEFHWLPVQQRIRFKTAVLVFKCLHELAPEYLSDDKLTTDILGFQLMQNILE